MSTIQTIVRETRETRRFEQIIRDRRLTAAGIRFVEQYQPPAIALPPAAKIADATDYRARHRAEYGAYERGYVQARRRATRVAERYEQFLTSASVEAGGPLNPTAVNTTTFVNVAALEAVTYLLGQAPLWVRELSSSYYIYAPTEPAPTNAWDTGFFVLARRAESAYDTECKAFTGRPYFCRGKLWYVKPLDLASHADRRPLGEGKDDNTLPASTVPWQDVLNLRPLVALAGLPVGVALKRAVRWMVGDWVKVDRRYTLPWALGASEQGQSAGWAAMSHRPGKMKSHVREEETP